MFVGIEWHASTSLVVTQSSNENLFKDFLKYAAIISKQHEPHAHWFIDLYLIFIADQLRCVLDCKVITYFGCAPVFDFVYMLFRSNMGFPVNTFDTFFFL